MDRSKPDCLLRGYTDMLGQYVDLQRLVACVTDRDWQERQLEYTGGDSAALTVVVEAIELCAAVAAPDLNAIVRLAQHRDRLRDRNSNIPVGLPAVWALVDKVDRAEAIASSITDPDKQARAVLAVAEAVAGEGDLDRAEELACSIADPVRQAQALRSVVMAGVYDLDRAERLARSISNDREQARALCSVAA
ncbi:MAG TPA: hypothetical protein VFX16_09730 [Pseudonocardiaceae bacterium]|nr:hypothetical protein [Pseudonocardiaceae bacterium]